MPSNIHESTLNVVSEGTRLEGQIIFDQIARVHGTLHGTVGATPGSTIILAESAVIEGNIKADTLLVDGYVKGDITASVSVTISRTGRVIGNITCPSLKLEAGAYFEGKSSMPQASAQ